LPALNKAREQANRVACASNLRQFCIALTQYSMQYKTYPYQKFTSTWGTVLPPGQPNYQYEVDGLMKPTETFWTVAQNVDGICSWPVVWQMREARVIGPEYRGYVCTSDTPPAGSHPQRGWYRSANVSNMGVTALNDGKSPQDVAFFAYMGPGVNGSVGWMYANPMAYVNATTYYDCVRPTYAYRNGAIGAREKGTFKIASCPNYWGVDAGPIFWFMSPHEGQLLSQGNTFPIRLHFRNYGYTDGHVEGFVSQFGYR
jgi:hypothetical protein